MKRLGNVEPSDKRAGTAGWSEARRLILDDFILYYFQAIHARVIQSYSRQFETRNRLSLVEWQILVALTDRESVGLTYFCTITGTNKSTVSRAVSRLRDRKFVMTRTDEEDTRHIRVSITPEGDAAQQALVEDAIAYNEAALKGLSAREVQTLFKLLKRVLSNFPQFPDE